MFIGTNILSQLYSTHFFLIKGHQCFITWGNGDSSMAMGWEVVIYEDFMQGICPHVDLMRFEDGIAIVSLESPSVMHFSPVERDGNEIPKAVKIPVYLSPGSLVIMWGDARYKWKHEINRKPGFQIWRGREIEQYMRTSITLRKLCLHE